MNMRKVIIRPFTYLKSSMEMECNRIIALLALQVLLLFMSKSFMAVVVIFSAVAASVVSTIICNRTKCFTNGNHYSYSVSIVQGLLVGMLLPETYPPFTVFVVTFCTMLIGKYIYKNFYYNFMNPSVFALAVLYIIGAGVFASSVVSLDLLSSRNPSQILIESGFFPTVSFDTTVTDFLNKTVFSVFKFSIPEGYISLLWDTHSAIPAFRFNFLTLISSVVLFMFDEIKIIIPAFFVIVYLALVRMMAPLFFNGIPMQGDILLAVFTSGTLFTAVFVINWYGSIPETIGGKIVFGVIAGILAFFICGCGDSPIGMVFTVFVADFIALFIQHFEMKNDFVHASRLADSLVRSKESGVAEVK